MSNLEPIGPSLTIGRFRQVTCPLNRTQKLGQPEKKRNQATAGAEGKKVEQAIN